MSYHIAIQEDACIGCGNCVIACPVTTSKKLRSILESNDELDKPVLQVDDGIAKLVDEDGCQLCGVCIGACPTSAIEIAFNNGEE